MKSKTPLFLLLTVLLSACQTPLTLSPGGSLHSTLAEFLDRTGAPGLQYVAVTPDGVLASHALGFSNLETSTPMTVDTPQPIFSVSKLFTSLLVLEGASKGRLDLDAQIPQVASPWPGSLSWRALLAHRSGLPDPILGGNFVYDADTVPPDRATQLADALRGVSLLSSVTTGQYSNLGYALLGEAWSAATGESWNGGVARQNQAMGLGRVTLRTDEHSARPYFRFSLNNWLFSSLLGSLEPRSTEIRGFSTVNRPLAFYFPAHGGLVMSAQTLADWLQKVALTRPSFLTEELWNQWFTTQGAIQMQGDQGTALAALGWQSSASDSQVFCHEGGGLGYSALVRVHRDRKVAEVLLVNEGMVNWMPALMDALDAVWQNSVSSGNDP